MECNPICAIDENGAEFEPCRGGVCLNHCHQYSTDWRQYFASVPSNPDYVDICGQQCECSLMNLSVVECESGAGGGVSSGCPGTSPRLGFRGSQQTIMAQQVAFIAAHYPKIISKPAPPSNQWACVCFEPTATLPPQTTTSTPKDYLLLEILHMLRGIRDKDSNEWKEPKVLEPLGEPLAHGEPVSLTVGAAAVALVSGAGTASAAGGAAAGTAGVAGAVAAVAGGVAVGKKSFAERRKKRGLKQVDNATDSSSDSTE